MKRHPAIELKCDACGSLFKRRYSYHVYITSTRGITDKFCSKACVSKAMKRNLPDSFVDEYLSGLSLTEVGELHKVSGSTIRNRLIELGIPIRARSAHLNTDKNPTKGKGHSPETRKLLSEITKARFSNPLEREMSASRQRQAMSDGKFKSVSKIELTVAAELDRLGITYSPQSLVRNTSGRFCACVDFMLDSGLAIEVNGTYWHSDPRHYPDGPQTASQLHTHYKYAKKMKALADLGIPVVEIWELDIRADVQKAVREALGL